MTLGSEHLVAFVRTTDLERARAFYVDVLALSVEEVTPFAAVLRSGEVVLRVTRVDALRPQPFTVLGWTVRDIRAQLRALARAGVTVERYAEIGQDDDGVWTTPGGEQVAWFRDPDGNVLSLTQLSPDEAAT